MAERKYCCFVIDVASIRGSEHEVKLLNIQREFDDQLVDELGNCSLLVKIIASIVIKIRNYCGDKAIPILYSNIKNRYSLEINSMVEQHSIFNATIVLIGQQSLFLFLGFRKSEISTILSLSKEHLFFSTELLDTANSIDNNCELKAYQLFRFDDAINNKKHIILLTLRESKRFHIYKKLAI